jgi:hypothetical protein
MLTAIGATAIAFTIAIGTAAGSVASETTPVIASTTTAQTTTPAQPEVAQFTLLANQECPVAV